MVGVQFTRVRALLALALGIAGTTARGQVVLPPKGAKLNHTHVWFQWPPVVSAESYHLCVVRDDRSADPFANALPVVDLTVDAAEPAVAVKAGLAFGRLYAWRVRAIVAEPLPWGPTYRFKTAVLPDSLPPITIVIEPQAAGDPEPGLTLFSIRSETGLTPAGLAVAVDATGEVVWFMTQPANVGDLRLLESGRLSFISGIRAYETTLGGDVTWASPDDPDLVMHHEVFPMPNGNFLALGYEHQEVLRDGILQTWKGDRIVEFDRQTNQIVWDWSSFAHFSTLDFDPLMMGFPQGTGYDWTHSNSAVYNLSDNSVYLSVRHMNRITRIDYATGDIVYNMGMDMPSGDADFGDNLFSWQHAPQLLPNGNMMVYDNGNRRDHVDQTDETGVTKAIELVFSGGDPPTSASIVWEFTQPEYSPFIGDADRLPGGHTLVTAGTQAIIHEVNESGLIIWQLKLPQGEGYLIYGAERIAELVLPPPLGDADDDGVADQVDNCPSHFNPQQNDCDSNGIGDVCAILSRSSQDCDFSGVPDECETNVPPCICTNTCSDIDGDGGIDLADFAAFALCFGSSPSFSADCRCSDLDGDGQINMLDFATFSLGFGLGSTNTPPNCP